MADIDDVTEGKIRFAPQILQRLGEELNPSVDQGLIELVKNAYDANATECHVWLDGHDGRSILIEDNGDGMDDRAIVDGWLVLGSSSKDTSATTRLGRVPAGNKGLGRLAALRLGHRAEMQSRPRETSELYSVTLDWDQFDDAETVDDVAVDIRRGGDWDGDDQGGTRIELVDLRNSIGRVDARRLARAMVLLADPFDDEPSSFRPQLHSEEFSDLAHSVRNRYFDDAEYHLEATLQDGVASVRATDWKGNVLWQGTHGDVRQGSNEPFGAPNAILDVWIFILSSETFASRRTELGAVRAWLQNFGGVHVYANGLRVAPYGNPGNDWLDMNLARVRSPELRPGTNTSIGRLRVTDPEGLLTQKTDRSGFIESAEFDNLRDFARDALEWLARRRVSEREAQRTLERQEVRKDTSASATKLRDEIVQVDDEGAKRRLEVALEKYDRDREKESERLRKDVQLYRTLATAGITAATFAHELNGNPLKRIDLATTTLEFAAKKQGTASTRVDDALAQIRSAAESLKVLSRATLDLLDRDKRRWERVLLNQVVRDLAETFGPFLDVRQVDLEIDAKSLSGEPFLRGSRAAVESVVTNLLNNSLTAVERADVPTRRIVMRTQTDSEVWELMVSDNGPGIELPIADIWLPGQSTRPGGTGLGLTIVRDTVADLNGTASARASSELGGAEFIVRLPILGVEVVPSE